MATVKSVKPGDNLFHINRIIGCRSNSFIIGIFDICPGSDFTVI